MSFDEEFKTIDLIVNSDSETRGVDSFALVLLKAERQMRRLLTHLVYQYPCFNSKDIRSLREALHNNRGVYFKGLEKGINGIYPLSVGDLVGENYQRLRERIDDAIDSRNKIFHGQLTKKYLNRYDLIEYVDDIRKWCDLLSSGAASEFGYDGFGRNSFQKSSIDNLSDRFKVMINNVEEYAKFISTEMQRR